MHELPITESILEIAGRHAIAHQASSVTKITLVIGELSSIIDDSVQFYWPMIAEGTICERAVLVFQRRKASMECQSCQTIFEPDSIFEICPACGGTTTKLVSGDEFYIDSIEITPEVE